ncbi:DNA-binding transcriptional regulator IlvY [Tritonibacter multivorans]|uniref:DNA-binding transcriptional regulator IlvY n=1 Tax=Tritonibacter multivorans TaxID=928856 RepID=A0A0P1GM37_9RHOB|nr:LysR family transcriptional regulator [Tritonibacter multivorans]MDA7419571.1 LysR family transcriptional regulator [Tritonibacter multivorans]CUH75735.1 DNA-binding transcriptional regulator IlvY [Tritonibacter multivorans]SFC61965.1 transcriptional regulator, LysR family [Tritonibacter multivorans]
MKRTPAIDDLVLFVQVAQAGGLAGAARDSGISTPTLSRKMQTLEQDLGRHLFLRGPRGYGLTAEGRALLADLADLIPLKTRLSQLLQQDQTPEVRITAGSWTAAFLARRIPVRDTWAPAFVEATARLDIARRGADIGIRNQRPDQPWLAARRTRQISYRLYARSYDVEGYVALSRDAAQPPSARWLRDHHGDDIRATAGSVRLLADLALAGAGRVVLPCFAAADLPDLHPVSDPITDLGHEEWLVSHHEARHDPPVRAALDQIATILTKTGT